MGKKRKTKIPKRVPMSNRLMKMMLPYTMKPDQHYVMNVQWSPKHAPIQISADFVHIDRLYDNFLIPVE